MHAQKNARAHARARVYVFIKLLQYVCFCVNAKKEFEHFRGRPIPRACAHVCARVDARVRARMHVHYAHTHTR